MSLPLPLFSFPEWLMNSMLGFDDSAYFQDQAQQIIDHYQPLDYSNINQDTSGWIPQSMACSVSLASELQKQRLEIDWLLQLEHQKLRTVVQEKTRQQAVLLQRYESKIMSLMRQRDMDLEVARNRSMELENFLAKAEMEAQEWQRKAIDNESMVIDLSNRLVEVREGKASICNGGAYDVESFCESSSRDCRNQEDQQLIKIACKWCKARSLCVVFLPCRHLCSCTACESLLRLCPICESVKDGSIEVFLN